MRRAEIEKGLQTATKAGEGNARQRREDMPGTDRASAHRTRCTPVIENCTVPVLHRRTYGKGARNVTQEVTSKCSVSLRRSLPHNWLWSIENVATAKVIQAPVRMRLLVGSSTLSRGHRGDGFTSLKASVFAHRTALPVRFARYRYLVYSARSYPAHTALLYYYNAGIYRYSGGS